MKKILYWIPTVLCMVIIFRFSNEPATTSDVTSGGVCKAILRTFYQGFESLTVDRQSELVESIQFYVRKMAHFSIYALLGMCSYFGVTFSSHTTPLKQRFAISWAICLLYAISDEVHQLFVVDRACQFRDVCIDFCGSVVGVTMLHIVLILLTKIRHSNKI